MQENDHAIHHEEAIASTSQQTLPPRNLSPDLQKIAQTLTRDTIQKICDEQDLVYHAFTQNEGRLLEVPVLLERIILFDRAHAGETHYFLREQIPSDGDCGFGILGVTKEHFCQVMLQHSADLPMRAAIRESMSDADETTFLQAQELETLRQLKAALDKVSQKRNKFIQKWRISFGATNSHQIIFDETGVTKKIDHEERKLIIKRYSALNKKYQKKLRALQAFFTTQNVYEQYFQAMQSSETMTLDYASLIAYAEREMPEVHLQLWQKVSGGAQLKRTVFQSQRSQSTQMLHILSDQQRYERLIPLRLSLGGNLPIAASSNQRFEPPRDVETMHFVQRVIAKTCELETLTHIDEQFRQTPQYDAIQAEFSSLFYEYFTLIDQAMIRIDEEDLFLKKRQMIQFYMDHMVSSQKLHDTRERFERESLNFLHELREGLLLSKRSTAAQSSTNQDDKWDIDEEAGLGEMGERQDHLTIKEQLQHISQCWMRVMSAVDYFPLFKIYLNDLLDLIAHGMGCNPLHLSIFHSIRIDAYCQTHNLDALQRWLREVGNTPLGLLNPLQLSYEMTMHTPTSEAFSETLTIAVRAFSKLDRNHAKEQYQPLLELLVSSFAKEQWNFLHVYAQYPKELCRAFSWYVSKLTEQNWKLGRQVLTTLDAQGRTPRQCAEPDSDGDRQLLKLEQDIVNVDVARQAFEDEVQELLQDNPATGQSGKPHVHDNDLVKALSKYFEENRVINLKRNIMTMVIKIENACRDIHTFVLTQEQRSVLFSFCESIRFTLDILLPFDELENQEIRALRQREQATPEQICKALRKTVTDYIQRLEALQQNSLVEREEMNSPINEEVAALLPPLLAELIKTYEDYLHTLDMMNVSSSQNDSFPARWIRMGMEDLHGAYYLSDRGRDFFAPYVFLAHPDAKDANQVYQGASRPIKTDGVVHFKFEHGVETEEAAPLRPAKDFMVHSLRPEGNTPPHRVLKLSHYGIDGCEFRAVQASLTMPGLDFEKVLQHYPQWVRAIDVENLAYEVERGLRTNPNDAKPNNLKFQLRAWDESTSRESVTLLSSGGLLEIAGKRVFARMGGFDNELCFFQSLRVERNVIYVDVCNIVYCIEPWMSAEISWEHRERYLQRPTQQVTLDWLVALWRQNQAYERLKEYAGFNEQDFKRLGLPIRLPPELIPFMVTREHLIREAYLNAREESLTINRLLKQVDPLMGEYYEALRREFQSEGDYGYINALSAVHGTCRGETLSTTGLSYDVDSLLVERNPDLQNAAAKRAYREILHQRVQAYERQVAHFKVQGQWLHGAGQQTASDVSLEHAIETYIANVDLSQLSHEEVVLFIQDIQNFEGIQQVVLRGLPLDYRQFERLFFRSGQGAFLSGLRQLTFLGCERISEQDLESLRRRCPARLRVGRGRYPLDALPQYALGRLSTALVVREEAPVKSPYSLVEFDTEKDMSEITDPTHALLEILREGPSRRAHYQLLLYYLLKQKEEDRELQTYLSYQMKKSVVDVSIQVVRNIHTALRLYQEKELLNIERHPQWELMYSVSEQQRAMANTNYYLRRCSTEGVQGLLEGLMVSFEEIKTWFTEHKEALLEEREKIAKEMIEALLTSSDAQNNLLFSSRERKMFQDYQRALDGLTAFAKSCQIPADYSDSVESGISWLRLHRPERVDAIEQMEQQGAYLETRYRPLLEHCLTPVSGERYLRLLERGVLPIRPIIAMLCAQKMQCAVRFWFLVDGELQLGQETAVQDPRSPIDLLYFMKDGVPCYDRLEPVTFSENPNMPCSSSSTHIGYDSLPILNLMISELITRGSFLVVDFLRRVSKNSPVDVNALRDLFRERWQETESPSQMVLNLANQPSLNCYVLNEEDVLDLIVQLEQRHRALVAEQDILTERQVRLVYPSLGDHERAARDARERIRRIRREEVLNKLLETIPRSNIYINLPYRCRKGMTRERLLSWEGAADRHMVDEAGRNLVGILACYTYRPFSTGAAYRLQEDPLYQLLTGEFAIPADRFDKLGMTPSMLHDHALIQGRGELMEWRKTTYALPQFRGRVLDYLYRKEADLEQREIGRMAPVWDFFIWIQSWFDKQQSHRAGHREMMIAEKAIAAVDEAMLTLSPTAFLERIENLQRELASARSSSLTKIFEDFIATVRSKRGEYSYLFNDCTLLISTTATSSELARVHHGNTMRSLLGGGSYSRQSPETQQMVVTLQAQLIEKEEEVNATRTELAAAEQRVAQEEANANRARQEAEAARQETIEAQRQADERQREAEVARQEADQLKEKMAEMKQERDIALQSMSEIRATLKQSSPAAPSSSSEPPTCGVFWMRRR